ncbi:MAG: motility protein A [Anaerotignaceae bacterium]
MDFTAIVGIVLGMVLILFGIGFQNIGNFISVSSLLIVVLGTFSALIASFPFRTLKQLPKHFMIINKKSKFNALEYIEQIQELALIARKSGLLALEDKANEMTEPFFKDGLMMIVDATTPEKVREILNYNLESLEERHLSGIEFYEKGGAYAPAFGLIGTLVGLVNMLMSMDLEGGAGELSANMGVALITTFYGCILANVIFIPLAKKLQVKSDEELLCKKIIIEGILSIQAGENPAFIKEKLTTFLPNYIKNGKQGKGKGDDAGGGAEE